MSYEYTIVPAQLSDIDAVIALRAANWQEKAVAAAREGLPRPLSIKWESPEAVVSYRGLLAYEIAVGEQSLLVARDAQETVDGFLSGNARTVAGPGYEEDSAQIVSLDVATSKRRRGIGRALLARFIKTVGDRPVWLEVGPTNYPARNLYRSVGFREYSETTMLQTKETA